MRHARTTGSAPIPPAAPRAAGQMSSARAATAYEETTRAAREAQRTRGVPPPHFLIPPGEPVPMARPSATAKLTGELDLAEVMTGDADEPIDTAAGKPVAIGALFVAVCIGLAFYAIGVHLVNYAVEVLR